LTPFGIKIACFNIGGICTIGVEEEGLKTKPYTFLKIAVLKGGSHEKS